MAKKVVKGEDGKEYVMKEKKPIYKRVWFIALVVVVLLVVIGNMFGSHEPDVKKVEGKKTEQTTKKEEKQQTQFKIGETASYKGYEVTVNKVDYSYGEDFIKPKEGYQFVIVNVTITNNSDKKAPYNPLDYQLNANGVNTDFTSYLTGVDTLNSGDLDKGATITGNLIGEAPKDGPLKVVYTSNFFDKEEKMSFILR